jgi:hypothetical protein
MDYYFLTPSANHKKVGVFPQSQSAHNFVEIQEKPFDLQRKIDLEFEIPIPILEMKARFTSMLSVVPIPSWFLVFENRFIDFISNFNLPIYQTWKMNCIHPKQTSQMTNYSLFYICNPSDNKVVDYGSSKFYIGKNSDWRFRGDSILIKDKNEFRLEQEKIMNTGLIKCDELLLNFSSISEDMIRLSNNPIANGYLISEKLKNELDKNQFSGMEFVPVHKKDHRIKVLT